ncbi:hypothetical protein H2198_007232 [Neophaeococcomyces mojaviensis]|uniref:Uncharacterized protein n=1 Tax=Neophaeococcomyces mojaviensis TaxID=3383035 RepID=A0ACC3A0M6_9EURO|nr:hypothetical protein H2198_007232 [Knufia sp. JES_112]
MAGSTLEKIVIKLSSQLLETEEERDHWRQEADSLDSQLASSTESLNGALKDNLNKDVRLSNLRKLLQQSHSQIVELDYKLRTVCLSAVTAKSNLRAEGKESEFVDATLQALQGLVGKDGGDILQPQPCGDSHANPRVPPRSSAYWDDTSSDSD